MVDKKIIPWIEGVVLSFPFLFSTILSIPAIYIIFHQDLNFISLLLLIASPIIIVCIIIIINFILYLFLKTLVHLETNILPYGIGFTFLFRLLLPMYPFQINSSFVPNTPYATYAGGVLWLISFVLLFYSYAVLIKNGQKRVNKITWYFTTVTLIFFTFTIIMTSESIIKAISFPAFFFVFPIGLFLIILGISAIYYVIYRRSLLSPRQLVWI